jgi:hypothetical protein
MPTVTPHNPEDKELAEKYERALARVLEFLPDPPLPGERPVDMARLELMIKNIYRKLEAQAEQDA